MERERERERGRESAREKEENPLKPLSPLFIKTHPPFFSKLSLSLSLSFADMDKLAVGPLVNPHRVSLSYPVAQNLAAVAEALSKPVSEVTVEPKPFFPLLFFSSRSGEGLRGRERGFEVARGCETQKRNLSPP